MLYYERKFQKKGFDYIIGVDEAGRGPLAGPVVAAAALLKTFRFKNRIDDSKKLSALARERAFEEIVGSSFFGIGVVDEKTIDRINILEATRLAMQEAVSCLAQKLDPSSYGLVYVIVDGNFVFDTRFPCSSIIRGDSRSKTIACASILAKVTRDRIMDGFDRKFPEYGFIRHKGYPTLSHRQAVKKFGTCAIHRMSFCRD